MFIFWCGFEIMHHELGNTPNTWIPGPELPCVTHVSARGNNIAPDRFLVINGQDIDKSEIFQFIPDARVGSPSEILKEWLTQRWMDWRTDRRHISFLYKKDDLIAKSYLAIWKNSFCSNSYREEYFWLVINIYSVWVLFQFEDLAFPRLAILLYFSSFCASLNLPLFSCPLRAKQE